jgi:hypothetical protein
MFKTLKPNDVFTPRNHELNKYSHIPRNEYLTELERAFNQGKHIFIHGESGAGKSWLFKEFVKKKKITYLICNLANASKFNSIDAEFENTVNRELKEIKISFLKTNEVGAEGEASFGELPFFTALSLKLKLAFKRNKQTAYKVLSKEPFEAALEFISRKTSKNKKKVIVLENFESIIGNEKVLKELANILTLIDDPRYGKYEVILFIIGTPNDILYYFSNTPANAPISNRLSTIKEVSKLTIEQTKELVKKGFNNLDYKIEGEETIMKHIIWITDRIPQRIQEYCYFLATNCESKRSVSESELEKTNIDWLGDSLYQAYTSVENAMNSRDTTIGRRNQTLYCLGQLEINEIRVNDIENLMRKFFPTKTAGVTINPSLTLAELSRFENPILKKSPKGDSYYFADPKYRICIRLMLFLIDEIVKKKDINEIK